MEPNPYESPANESCDKPLGWSIYSHQIGALGGLTLWGIARFYCWAFFANPQPFFDIPCLAIGYPIAAFWFICGWAIPSNSWVDSFALNSVVGIVIIVGLGSLIGAAFGMRNQDSRAEINRG